MFDGLLDHGMSLWSLFGVSFIAATLLPAGSEALLSAMVLAQQYPLYWIIIVATIGNTLGGLLTYALGRLARRKHQQLQSRQLKGVVYFEKYVIYCLLFSWLPLIGDIFCFVAGWLKLNSYWSGIFLLIGKMLRYLVIAAIAQGFI